VLDFETIILSSANEGILPANKQQTSFIPFDVKIAYGLPTYKEKEAIFSYHFFRLLQRAKNIFILYNIIW
jgi:inactivated superfamily I helicase